MVKHGSCLTSKTVYGLGQQELIRHCVKRLTLIAPTVVTIPNKDMKCFIKQVVFGRKKFRKYSFSGLFAAKNKLITKFF